MDQETAARFKEIEKRLRTLERAVLPEPLDDPLEHPHDHGQKNATVEGSDA